MGRLSEAFWFCDEKTVPTENEIAMNYSYIHRNKELLAFRKTILKLRKEKKQGKIEGQLCLI